MSNEYDDPYESEEYQRFVIETAKTCRQCPSCHGRPCDSCLAGGVCDEFICRHDDYDSADYEGVEDNDDDPDWGITEEEWVS